MIFNSLLFLLSFPVIFFIVILLRNGKSHYSNLENVFLLIASFFVYASYSLTATLYLISVIVFSYFAALQKKKMATLGAVLVMLPLITLKYYDFFTAGSLPGLNLAVPMGISFFSLQAIGYVVDVQKKRVPAERNFINYALFVSFFPQIVSGPISKAADLLPQINSKRQFSYKQSVQGLKWLLWGMFIKVVVADRLGLYVDPVFHDYDIYSGSDLACCAFYYAMQIYCDFAGYSFMAVGVGQLLGFELINNFKRPYFAASVTDFWHRWHLSLSIWLRDYIYIPLGGSHCSKWHNYANIIITFMVSGLWHGANWTFILWGMLHGIYQIIEKQLGLQKFITPKDCVMNYICSRTIRTAVTFSLVTLAWIFFRMPTISDAWAVLAKIFTACTFSLYLPEKYILVMMFIVIAKDFIDEFFPKVSPIHSKNIYVRWSAYLMIVLFIILFGVFDAGQFIYAQF